MAAFRQPGLLALLTILILATGCAPTGPAVRDTGAQDPALIEAERLEGLGDHEAAARALQALAMGQTPDRPIESALLGLRAAEAWLRAGRAEEARDVLEDLDSASLPDEMIPRWHLAWAEIAFMEGELDAARLRLAQAAERLNADDIDRYELIDELVERAAANPARDAFSELESSLYDGSFTPDLALALLIDHPLDSLRQLERIHRHRPELSPWLDLAVTARQALLDPARLAADLQDWEARHPAVGFPASAASGWLDAWRQTRSMARRILVALPGRDRMQSASEALRNGILSAWFEMRPQDRPELIFREVADREGAILGLLFEARELGVDFMIGPLERDQVDSLVGLPDAGLPILLLNHPSDPALLEAQFGEIQAIGLIPEEEAELAAVQALIQGHERALILAQSSDWGQRVAEAFESTFRLGGGRIMDQAEYSPIQPDHSALLEVLLNLDESERRATELGRLLGEAVEFEAQPRTDVDLIFLAARPQDARLIRPQLRFFGVGDLPVYATSHLLAGAPDPVRDGDIDGVTLPIAPWFIDDSPFGADRQRSERRFNGLDNPLLSILHALGADAFELARWTRRMQNDPDLYLAGRTGRLRLPGGRRVERDLPFFELIEGQAVPLQ
jgi:outer membrane PBP1 activator LpoA protein